ncbi:MAG: hypothetical protein EZS28_055285, partial [Streblomastix strix]
PSLSGNSVTTAQAQNYVRERNSFSLSANFWIYATLENKRPVLRYGWRKKAMKDAWLREIERMKTLQIMQHKIIDIKIHLPFHL